MMPTATARNLSYMLVFLLGSFATSWSQNLSDQGASDSEEQSTKPAVSEGTPVPEDQAAPPEEFPATYSTAGIGMPSVESPLRNYLLFGISANGSVQYSQPNALSAPYQTDTISRAFGTLDYMRTKGRSQTAIDYRGGGFFFTNSNNPDSSNQVQELSVQQRFSWPRTKLVLVDSLSNFPGGDFGVGWFGGSSAYNLGVQSGVPVAGNANSSDYFGFNTFGGIGQANYLTNAALAQVSHDITPRSTLAFSGAYAITDHIGDQDFINSKQATGSVAYGYQLTARTGIGAFYGYQDFRFIGGDDVTTHTVQATLSYQISGTTSFTLGGGPEFTRLHDDVTFTIGSTAVPFTSTRRQTGASAYASVSHSLRSSAIALSYTHQVTGGSGLFAGASSDIATGSWSRSLSRVWEVSLNGGIVRLSSIGNSSTALLGNSYGYGFVGVGIQRQLGSRFSAYASYQFNDQSFDNSSCAATSSCNGLEGRHVAVVGISWRSRPVVLDFGDNQNSAIQPFGNPPVAMRGNQPSLP